MNRIRVVLLSLFAVCVSLSAQAQRSSAEVFNSKHEVRFTLGVQSLFTSGGRVYDDMCGWSYCDFSADSYNSLLTFRSVTVSPTLSLGYSYEFSKWLSVGAALSYSRESELYYNRIDEKVVSESSINHLTIVPMVRFTYLNRPMVRLYSQLGLGVRLQSGRPDAFSRVMPASVTGSITYFGVSVGKKFFGSMELASGAQGVFVLGAGYRF